MTISSQNLNAKFVRGFHMYPNTPNTNGTIGWIHRLAYEFWCFCVNGDNNLVGPGLGSVANSQTTGSYINMPVGWESGSNILLASGSDGTTVSGLPYFNVTGSNPFSPNMAGKWLTMWQSGSTSTDDSIYLITKWNSSSSITLDPTYGGTSIGPSGSVPQLTTRSNINYRVVDYLAVSNLSYVTNNYWVAQFSSAADLNPGSARPQAQFGGNGAQFFTQLCITLSASGSWDGTHFVGFKEFNTTIYPETTNSGPGSGGWGTPDWTHNSGGADGFVTIIGTKISLALAAGGNIMVNGGSAFHVEIPQRLYPQAYDPNLICAMNFGNLPAYVAAQVGYGYGHRFFPSPYDTTVRRWAMQVRCFTGTYWNSTMWGNQALPFGWVNRWRLLYNQPQNKLLMPDGILSLPYINGQGEPTGNFSLARARCITLRFTSTAYSQFMRVGDNNDRWIHVNNGVLWPWDHAIVSGRPIFTGL